MPSARASNSHKDFFLQWLKKARKGSQYLYYTGSLMRERVTVSGDGRYVPVTALSEFADLVWDAGQMGLVCLMQRKVKEGTYDYIAVRTGKAPLSAPKRDFSPGTGHILFPVNKLPKPGSDGPWVP